MAFFSKWGSSADTFTNEVVWTKDSSTGDASFTSDSITTAGSAATSSILTATTGNHNVAIGHSAGSTLGMTPCDPLTDEEQKKLEQLKAERKRWIKQKRLRSFQGLPAHIRQEIVDEACIKVCLNEMEDVDERGFEGSSEISDLERKNSNYQIFQQTTSVYTNITLGDGLSVNWDGVSCDHLFKYKKIIYEFTKDELMEAHAAATMEESLSD